MLIYFEAHNISKYFLRLFKYRVLPLQPQKTLDTDLSVPEFLESVKIYQVSKKTFFDLHVQNFVPCSLWGLIVQAVGDSNEKNKL